MKINTLIILLLLSYTFAFGSDTLSTKKDRTNRYIIAGSEIAGYSASYLALGQLWYSGYPHTSFHWQNDIHEWMQMDKFGHSWSAYWIARTNYRLFRSTNYNDNSSILVSMASSWLFMSTIEFFDGHSTLYGASPTDILANTIGVSFFGFQQYFWKEQKILYKFCFYPSAYAKYNPNEFGTNYLNNILKDYNGQVYWFSVGLRNITNKQFFPAWLNVAVGIAATGMTGGAANNKSTINGIQPLPDSQRERQLYFSFDINTEKIKTKNKALRSILFTLNSIKFPLPSLQINRGGSKIVLR